MHWLTTCWLPAFNLFWIGRWCVKTKSKKIQSFVCLFWFFPHKIDFVRHDFVAPSVKYVCACSNMHEKWNATILSLLHWHKIKNAKPKELFNVSSFIGLFSSSFSFCFLPCVLPHCLCTYSWYFCFSVHFLPKYSFDEIISVAAWALQTFVEDRRAKKKLQNRAFSFCRKHNIEWKIAFAVFRKNFIFFCIVLVRVFPFRLGCPRFNAILVFSFTFGCRWEKMPGSKTVNRASTKLPRRNSLKLYSHAFLFDGHCSERNLGKCRRHILIFSPSKIRIGKCMNFGSAPCFHIIIAEHIFILHFYLLFWCGGIFHVFTMFINGIGCRYFPGLKVYCRRVDEKKKKNNRSQAINELTRQVWVKIRNEKRKNTPYAFTRCQFKRWNNRKKGTPRLLKYDRINICVWRCRLWMKFV